MTTDEELLRAAAEVMRAVGREVEVDGLDLKVDGRDLSRNVGFARDAVWVGGGFGWRRLERPVDPTDLASWIMASLD